MKINVIIKCKNFLGAIKEKILEWYDYMISHWSAIHERKSNLAEEYHISEAYACNEQVKEFLSLRIRNSLRNRYRIVIVTTSENITDRVQPGEIAIGIVRLCCRQQVVDEATLVIKEEERNGLIYWRFK